MRRTFGLTIAAGLLALWPASTARAQAAYGYDSYYYNLPQSAGYWYGAGYSGMYTDQSTTSFATNGVAPYRGTAPYATPPFSQFSRTDGLANVSPGAVTRAPVPVTVRRPVVVQRRGLFGRVRGRR
jgi:hypothetical protein